MDEWIVLFEAVGKSWHAVGAPSRVTAAVSGGADSMALLAALRELALRESIFLTAAHVDHGLREASGKDAAFVKSVCESWGGMLPGKRRFVPCPGPSSAGSGGNPAAPSVPGQRQRGPGRHEGNRQALRNGEK